MTEIMIYVVQEKEYSMEELQSMLMEMAKGFENPSWHYGPSSSVDETQCSKKARLDSNFKMNSGSHFHHPGLHMYETGGYCN